MPDGSCIYKCPPKPPKKIHKEGIRQKREQMLSVNDAREAFKAVVPQKFRYSTNFRSLVTARIKLD
mgnify:CR=1 FL=1